MSVCRDEVNVNVAAASFCDGLTPLHLAAEGGALTEACLASLLQVKEVLTTVYTTVSSLFLSSSVAERVLFRCD